MAANTVAERRSTLYISALPSSAGLFDDAHAPHDQIGGGGRADHQRRRPEKSALDIGQRQAFGVHAENAGHQRRRQQHHGHDRERMEMPVALLLDPEVQLFFEKTAALAQLDDVMVEAIEPLRQLAGMKPQR